MAISRLLQPQHTMGAVFNAVPTVDTDHGFVHTLVPLNGPDETRLTTIPATNAAAHEKLDSAVLALFQSLRRADFGTRWIFAGPADYDGKTPLHASYGPYGKARFTQAGPTLPPRAGEHTALATYATFGFQNGKPHFLS